MSKPPTSHETAISSAMTNVAERMADIPRNLRARAVNAVGPALQARGEWLRLSTREAVAVAVLIAVKTELEAQAAAPDVAGRCPACGGTSLFLADGGYVTCRRIDCPNPDAAHEAIEERAGANAYDRAVNAPMSAEAAAVIRQKLADGTAPRRRVRRSTDGPTVREAAADDRRWPLEREGE
jgi:hypothetical protein